MVFFTAPCTDEGEQPDGAPWPEDNPARLAVYNRLVREVAAAHPKTDSVVDLERAVCPATRSPRTIHGVAVRRTDGVHFTNAGRRRLAPRSCRRSWRRAGRSAAETATPSTVVPSGAGTG